MKSKKETSTPESGFQPPRPRTAILADIASLGAAVRGTLVVALRVHGVSRIAERLMNPSTGVQSNAGAL